MWKKNNVGQKQQKEYKHDESQTSKTEEKDYFFNLTICNRGGLNKYIEISEYIMLNIVKVLMVITIFLKL